LTSQAGFEGVCAGSSFLFSASRSSVAGGHHPVAAWLDPLRAMGRELRCLTDDDGGRANSHHW